MSEDSDMQILKDAVSRLGEHFESVQIFATRVQDKEDGDEGTVNCNFGNGNWFARYGQIKEWVLKNEERARIEVQKESE